jgi:hypothetical protein
VAGMPGRVLIDSPAAKAARVNYLANCKRVSCAAWVNETRVLRPLSSRSLRLWLQFSTSVPVVCVRRPCVATGLRGPTSTGITGNQEPTR